MENNTYIRKILVEKTQKRSFFEMLNDWFESYVKDLNLSQEKLYNVKYKRKT